MAEYFSREVAAHRTTKEEAGSCCGCSGLEYTTVFKVILKNVEFRLCRVCRAELIKQLQEA